MKISKQQMQTIIDNAPAGVDIERLQEMYIDRGYEIEGIDSQQAKQYIAQKRGDSMALVSPTLPTMETEPEKTKGGFIQGVGKFLEDVAKDAGETLVVKPVARATEAVTRLAAPNSQAAAGFEAMADGTVEPLNILGMEVPPVQGGSDGAKQIVGDAFKTASYLFPYGRAAKAASGAVGPVAGAVGAGATGGYLADVGFGLEGGEGVVEALTPGLGTMVGGAVPLAGPAVRSAGRAASKIGREIGELAVPTSSREAKFLQIYKADKPFLERVGDVLRGTEKSPQTAAKTSVEKGLVGTKSGIGVQARRANKVLWSNVIEPALNKSPFKVNLPQFFNKIADDINVMTGPEESRKKALLKALDSFKDDYSGRDAVTLPELQKLKEGWAEFIPEKAYKGENISGAANQVRKMMADESRQTIYSQLGDDVKKAYIDYGNLMGIQKWGQTSMTGAKLKGGTGGFISELASQAITPVATVAGQVIYRLGKGIELIGDAGAKTVGQLLKLDL